MGNFMVLEARVGWDGMREEQADWIKILGIEDVKGMCERNQPDVLVCACFFFCPGCGLCLVFALLGFDESWSLGFGILSKAQCYASCHDIFFCFYTWILLYCKPTVNTSHFLQTWIAFR
jgi:hypothetical protein